MRCLAARAAAYKVLGLSLLARALLAQPAPETARLAALIEPFLKQNQVPGVSLAVVREGQLLMAAGFGTTAVAGGQKVTGDTRFRIASVTKPLTATLVLQLASADRLALEDSARARCRAFAPPGGEPTLRDLLAHQGGVRHPTDKEDTTISGDVPRLAAAVARLSSENLRFTPRTSVLYSSWGYAVLGCAVEEATGGRFFDELRARVLDPAGMTATVADRPDFAAQDFSPGFRVEKGRPVPSEVVDTRFKQPASGAISTASDLARFVMALHDGKLLQPASRQLLFTPQTTSAGQPTDFTLGLMVGKEPRWGPAFYHTGSMEGTTALLYLIPTRSYAVVLLANRERFAREIAALVPSINEIVLGPGSR